MSGRVLACAALLLIGCGETCAEDEVVTRDGCVPAADSAGWDEETLPGYRLRACRPLEAGDGALDLQGGCAAGVCLDDDYPGFVDVLGTPSEVDATASSIQVDWDAHGLYAYFDDDDGDNQPDEGPVERFVVNGRAAGSTPEGVAIDHSLACFVQILGQPDDVDTDNGLVQTLRYDALELRIHDFSGQNAFEPDGYVDVISFDGRP